MARSLAVAAALALAVPSAGAIEIELLGDVAPDRVERQRAYNRGAVPFPGTPDLARLDQRLAAKGLTRGSAIFVRVFKASSELELWMQKGDTFVLLDTYPICHWTGTLGPKLKEGDKQSPEGFYSVAPPQMRRFGRWPQAFNLGFPNIHDRVNRRTGSHILIHGGCSSTGCFAMTELVQNEIRALAEAALAAGQARFHVHVFPFRMTAEAMAAYASHAWIEFWRDLKAGYDSFERTRVPPRIGVCGTRYFVRDGEAGHKGDAAPLALMRPLQLAHPGQVAPHPEAVCMPSPATVLTPQLRPARTAVQRIAEASQPVPGEQGQQTRPGQSRPGAANLVPRPRNAARSRGGQRVGAPAEKASPAFGEVYH